MSDVLDGLDFHDDDTDSVQKFARGVVSRVCLALKLSTMHSLDNDAMGPPIRALLAWINPRLGDGDPVALQCLGENFFLNQEVIKQDSSSYDASVNLREIFERLEVHELRFSEALDESEFREFLARFQLVYGGDSPKDLVKERFEKISLRIIQAGKADAMGSEIDERQNVLRAYALMTITLQDAVDRMKSGRRPQLSRLRRAIQGLSDASTGHDSLLLGLTRFPDLTGEAVFHLSAVTALVLLMTRKLGLQRKLQIEACMAAAVHDLGRAELPDPYSGNEISDEMGEAVRRVPLRTLLEVLNVKLSTDSMSRAAISYEQTLPASTDGEYGPSVMARIISVACAFDLMASPRPPRQGIPPDQALRIIIDHAGDQFDSRVTRLFAQTIGMYPVGTTVKLSTGETGIVMEVPDDPAAFARPSLKIIRTPSGPADFIMDLAQAGAHVTITETIDPSEEQINVPAFLLA